MRPALTALTELVVLVALVALTGAALPGAAHAEGEGTGAGITITGSDTTAFPEVTLEVSIPGDLAGAVLAPGDVTVTEGGAARSVAGVQALGVEGLEVVIVMDRSGSMRGTAITAARAAVQQFAAQLPATVPIGLVTFGSTASVALAPSLDRDALGAQLAAVTAGGSTSLYDSVVLASRLFSSETPRRVLVLLSDGGDTASIADLDAAITAVQGVQVNVIELVSSESNGLALAALGGTQPVRSASDPVDLAQAYDDVAQGLVNHFVVTYRSGATRPGATDVEVAVAIAGSTRSTGTTVEAPASAARAATGTTGTTGGESVAPAGTVGAAAADTSRTTLGVGGETSPTGPPMKAAGLVFGGLLLAFAAVWQRPRASMRDRLMPLPPSAALVTSEAVERPHRSIEGLVERALEHRDRRRRLDAALGAAGSDLTAVDVALRTAVGTVVAAFLASMTLGVMFGVGVFVTIPWYVKSRIEKQGARRRRDFVEQLPDVLQVLSSMLRSGYGLMQSLDAMAAEANDPAREWFQRVIMEVRTGRDVVQSLTSLSDRVGSIDFAWVVAAVEINREVGGDLAHTLESLADTIRGRDRLRRQVRTLTAEGRMSAYLMLALPPLVALFSSITNPDFFGVLFHGGGVLVLVLAGFLMIVGYSWMRKIISKVM